MTLKLLLDWAQIIYSMKNIKIYPKDWLQLHPYKQSDPTDSYYTNIANRIYGMLEETRLAYSFEKDEVKQISIRMAAYFEDVISGLNIWRSFITEHKALYGKFLPFYTPDDHYYDDEVNYEDIRFLLWHYTQQYHGFHKGTFVSPDNAANGDTAKLIYQMFCDEWTTAPENERLQQLFAPETRYEDVDKYNELLHWFHYQCYLFTDSHQELTDTVNAYREAKAAAIAQKKAANEAIGEAQKPDLDKIKAEKEETETVYQMAEKKYNQLKMDCKNNQEIFTALSARMEKRQEVIKEHARIDALYRMTSGNVSGSRMDLETFVQRYYLERILYAANRRFQEMSAGQFELRMYDLKKAGEGKNRGLDLMVYSTVTGKEREVRTLSGGESFMAALSLALGMADQIKQSSAAINLDMMFIDEGFGSLDEHSRNQAVRVLQEMAEGSRLIGIISHVSELKQEIEDQLIVTKDENGSHVKWQIS